MFLKIKFSSYVCYLCTTIQRRASVVRKLSRVNNARGDPDLKPNCVPFYLRMQLYKTLHFIHEDVLNDPQCEISKRARKIMFY